MKCGATNKYVGKQTVLGDLYDINQESYLFFFVFYDIPRYVEIEQDRT